MSERELLTGWGRTAPTAAQVSRLSADQIPTAVSAAGPRGVIARGLGRSYGDVAQNAGGGVLVTEPGGVDVDHDRRTARIGAGTSLHDVLRTLLPLGYFVPVTPGTRFVTLGGAVACDVHGKNHHRVGSLGNHIVELDLVTADGAQRTISPTQEPELFWATVGGLGLTGVITSVVLELVPVESGYMRVDTERLADLDAVMDRIQAADRTATHSVAWIDTMAKGRSLGRSVLSLGEHATRADLTGRLRDEPLPSPGQPRLAAPALMPPGVVSRATVRAFNELWFRKAPRHRVGEVQPIAPFFYPLDGVDHWSRLYGARGCVQYQFVLPDPESGRLAVLLERVSADPAVTFLAVLKRFGPGNRGLLSFPTAGWTLAVDIPVRSGLAPMLQEWDREVADAGGRVYLAKDSRLSQSMFDQMYPRAAEFRAVRRAIDPHWRFRSDLSRRLDL
ncbi:MAG: FAD-binding oxidoreductase [Nocardioides sp.]|uniref:FAD-binding protein n=1 Tax=Nocardioides sp. TaxID=35761 RepID=UPI0039E69718